MRGGSRCVEADSPVFDATGPDDLGVIAQLQSGVHVHVECAGVSESAVWPARCELNREKDTSMVAVRITKEPKTEHAEMSP